MKITQLPSKILTNPSVNVEFPLSDKNLRHIKEMIKYIDDSQLETYEGIPGVGLAAPQIGISLRMFYVNIPVHDKKNYVEFLINPTLLGESEAESAINDGEGCLSIDETKFKTQGYIKRKFKVIIKGYSYFQKKETTITKVGYEAVVLATWIWSHWR